MVSRGLPPIFPFDPGGVLNGRNSFSFSDVVLQFPFDPGGISNGSEFSLSSFSLLDLLLLFPFDPGGIPNGSEFSFTYLIRVTRLVNRLSQG